MARIGILGGSFNPVHTGHVRMAIEVMERFRLDRVEIVPASIPPHKSGAGILPFEERVRLLELAFEGVEGVVINTLESKRPGPSYTIETLAEYKEKYEGDDLFFIMGTDNLVQLSTWKDGLDIYKQANMIVVRRDFEDRSGITEFVEKYWPEAKKMGEQESPAWRFHNGSELLYARVPLMDVSSTNVRARWQRRTSLALLVPPVVEKEIDNEDELYVNAWGRRR
ncbi:MAG: nicotinate (nicotinamide) nucleotide adenylyltransferase [Desulfovibrio sp.]